MKQPKNTPVVLFGAFLLAAMACYFILQHPHHTGTGLNMLRLGESAFGVSSKIEQGDPEHVPFNNH
ncbi:MAG: hypothetical protein KGS48_11150 [Bacteroidetes bacterium]|nr:hypothetical protein [Bacteroidota bacterium]